MKQNRLATIACLALIIAGVFFTTNHAEAKSMFPHPGNTGCTAPVGGVSIGPCGKAQSNVGSTPAKTPAPKHWHRHWHRHYHARFHHFRFHHARFHHFRFSHSHSHHHVSHYHHHHH